MKASKKYSRLAAQSFMYRNKVKPEQAARWRGVRTNGQPYHRAS